MLIELRAVFILKIMLRVDKAAQVGLYALFKFCACVRGSMTDYVLMVLHQPVCWLLEFTLAFIIFDLLEAHDCCFLVVIYAVQIGLDDLNFAILDNEYFVSNFTFSR